jgi:outer membrane autotransporter protein
VSFRQPSGPHGSLPKTFTPSRALASRRAAVLFLALLLTTSQLTTVALAAGGKGGGTGGGVGGTGYGGMAGGDGDDPAWLHAGGGGGGAGGGAGGIGGPGSGIALDGRGGTGGDGGLNDYNGESESNGQQGENGDGTSGMGEPGGSGGGGGAGGAGFYYTTDIDLATEPGPLTYVLGGRGGDGGLGFAKGGAGGDGGDGGGGAVMDDGYSVIVDIDSVTGGDGGEGGSGALVGRPGVAGHGGNGGAGVVVSGGGDVTVDADRVSGGSGGSGGDGRFAHVEARAGDGGNGGAGIDARGGGDVTINHGTVEGGTGASGGDTATDSGTGEPANTGAIAGNGGAGGVGINATNADSVTLAAGTSVIGGDGNEAGVGSTPGTAGLGGVGIVASNGTVVTVAGTVSGGMDGTGTTRAHAIDFTGGGNTLVLEDGYVLNGDAVSDNTGSDALTLSGTGDASFDLSLIGDTFQNFDSFGKAGSGIWTLTGTSSFSGTSSVTAGTLVVNGTLASSLLTVASGGTLKGSGTVGATTVSSGGTIAPGNSIGTLNVTGNLTLSVGSIYAVEVAPNGASDLIAVTGSATLADGAVTVTSASGANLFPTEESRYTILTATGGVTGNFDPDVNTDALAFFDGALDYTTPNSVILTLTRNDTSLPDVAQGGNQKNTAGAIESLGASNPLYTGILGLSSDEAQSAYQQLSGESLGSADQGQQQSSGLVSTSVVDRVNQAFDALDGAEASGYMPVPESGVDYARSIWISGYGARANVAASGQNAASATDTAGLTFGLDGELGDWTVGVMGGYGRSANNVAALGTSIGSSDYSAGVYAGTEWDSIRLVLGAVYTQSAVSSTRNITLPTAQTLTADYAASTASLFGEAAKEFDFGAVSLTPYAGVQYVRSMGAAYAEQGGTAALSVAARTSDIFYTTLGLRSSADFAVGGDMLLSLGAGAGWKHAFADQATVTHSFLSGGNSFAVSSAEVPADRLAVEASAGLDVSSSLALDLGYTGEFTSNAQTSQVQGGVKGSF